MIIILLGKNMNNYYSSMLLKGLPNSEGLTVQDIPLVIDTVDTSYSLAFIDFEKDNILGINYTVEDGTERFVILNKEYVVDVKVLYQQDVDILTDDDKQDSDVMYH